jgi:hypothetical protein
LIAAGDDDADDDEEETGGYSYVLTSKDALWTLLSKCMKTGCAEQCEIAASTKGGIYCQMPIVLPQVRRSMQQ